MNQGFGFYLWCILLLVGCICLIQLCNWSSNWMALAIGLMFMPQANALLDKVMDKKKDD